MTTCNPHDPSADLKKKNKWISNLKKKLPTEKFHFEPDVDMLGGNLIWKTEDGKVFGIHLYRAGELE